jgi:hypothetical protein
MGQRATNKYQLGIESTLGTAVTPTRQLIGQLTLVDSRVREVRDEERASFGGDVVIQDLSYLTTWKYVARATVDELVYWLALGARGDITPTQPSVGTAPLLWRWAYSGVIGTSIPALKSATLVLGDTQQAQKAPGCCVSKITLKGGGEKVMMLEVDLLGFRQSQGTLASLTHPTTNDMKSLLNTYYLDGTWAGLGTTRQTGTMYDFEWTFDAGITPDLVEDGALIPFGYHRNTPKVNLKLTGKWNANTVAQWLNYDANTRQFLRFVNIGPASGALNQQLQLDTSVQWTKVDVMSQNKNGTNLVTLEGMGMEDVTGANIYKAQIDNLLSTL